MKLFAVCVSLLTVVFEAGSLEQLRLGTIFLPYGLHLDAFSLKRLQ